MKRSKTQADDSINRSNGRRRQDHLQRVLDNLFAFVAVLSPDGVLVDANRAPLEAAGIAAADVIGRPLWDSYWWNFSQESRTGLQEAIARAGQGQTLRYDSRIRVAGDQKIWIDFQLAPLRDDAGAVTGLTASAIDISERKRMEEKLRERDEQLRLAYEGGRIGMWSFDFTTQVADCTTLTMELLGLAPVLPPPTLAQCLTLIHEEDRDRLHGSWLQTVEQRAPFVAEFRTVRTDGSVHWLLAHARHRSDANGQPVRSFGIVMDITEAKRSEQALRDRSQQLVLAMKAGRSGTFDWDLRTHVLQWSDELLGLYGLQPGEFGQRYEDWIARLMPDDREGAVQLLQRALATGDLAMEFRIRRPDGEIRWMHARGQVMLDPDAQPSRLIGIHVDITDYKRAQEALHESEARYHFALQAGRMGSWDWDLAADRVYWSEGQYALFGLQPGEVEASYTAWRDRVHPDDAERVETELRATMADRREYHAEYRVVWGDGSIRWVEARGRYTFVGSRATRITGVMIDVTERKEAEDLRKEADRRKDEFIAMLGHELRNPLAPITTAVELMEIGGGLGAQQAEALEIIRRQAAHLTRLVDDLLDVSRITQGVVNLRPTVLDLGTVLSEAVKLTQPLLHSKHHRLTTVLARQPIQVRGDPTRLMQVFTNLLTNAAKYTPAGGRIEVRMEANSDQATVFVKDNGIGIDPPLLGRLFELFVQGPRSMARSEGGLGVGLTLVRRIVQLHGGEVTAASEGIGRGSEFSVRLPLAVESATAPVAEHPAAAAVPPASLKLLIVDDNIDAANTLGILMGLNGHQTRTEHNGAAALHAREEWQPDVVLLDIGLPDMGGYEVGQRMRASGFGGMLIAVTGYGQDADRTRSEEAGFDAHLVKPVLLEKLKMVISGSLTK